MHFFLEAGAIVISILHMRKVSHREAKGGHTATKSQSWALNAGGVWACSLKDTGEGWGLEMK